MREAPSGFISVNSVKFLRTSDNEMECRSDESTNKDEENASPTGNFVEPIGDPVFPPPATQEKACQTETFSILPFLNDSAKLYTFTGVANEKSIDLITECALSIAPDWALSVLYGVSSRTCSNYFKDTVQLLAEVLKGLIYLPSKEETLGNMPKCFKKFWKTRIVIDCAEIPVEKQKSLKERIMTYSHYKGRHTVKFAVGVSPGGLIIFLSQTFGGRTSDKKIVAASGILDKLDLGDGVMVDKGFMIEEECLERGLILYRPPFKTRNQRFTKAEAMRTAEIASARVHVERVIKQLRDFSILRDQITTNLLPIIDQILLVCAALVNLSPPVLALDRF